MRASVAALCLLACSPAATPRRPAAPTPPAINTGDPIPDAPSADPRCPDGGDGVTRWVDSDPRTPFFVTDVRGIHEVDRHCCAPWAREGTEWHELGPYGEVVGRSKLVGGEGYDVTQCYELAFELLDGKAGVGVRASADGNWRAPAASVRWQPARKEREAYAPFMTDLQRLHLDDPPAWQAAVEQPPLPAIEERTLFFQVSGAPYGKSDEITHYAAAGGPIFTIARLNEKGRWIAAHVDNQLSASGVTMAYTVLGVFDVDGDDVPEVLVHVNAADSWWDVLLRLDENGLNWKQAAESVGGSTA